MFLSFCLRFWKFQPDVAYENIAYKKSMFPETNDATLGFQISFKKCCGKSNRFNDTHTAKLCYTQCIQEFLEI